MTDSFAFVLNFYDYAGPLPLEVAPGVYFDLANPAQALGIRCFLETHGRAFVAGPWLYFVEPLQNPPPGGFSYVQVPHEKANFRVLNFTGNPGPIWDFCKAAQLTDSELEIAATFHPSRPDSVHQIDPPRMFHFSQQHIHPILRKVDANDLTDAGKHQSTIATFSTVSDPIRASVLRAFQDFVQLSTGQRGGHLVLLGYFGVIESLITHDPHQLGDSLNHQLSTKMSLLARRFSRPLEPAKFFTVSDPRTTWKRLYELRSLIAHGGSADFKKGRLRDLRDGATAFRFVRESLKRLIVQALHEPELMYDLKAC